jgi:hypothetical protein
MAKGYSSLVGFDQIHLALTMEIWKRVVVLSLFSAIVLSGMTIYLYLSYGILDILGLKLITVGVCVFAILLLILMAVYAWKNPDVFSMYQNE